MARALDLAIGERTGGPLFVAADGRRLDRHGAGRIVRKTARRAGIGKLVTPHTPRHAFITVALDAGVPLRDVQEATTPEGPMVGTQLAGIRSGTDVAANEFSYGDHDQSGRRLSADRRSAATKRKGAHGMPLINVKVIEGVFSASQRREIVQKLTDAMVSIEGENMRGVTWCVLEEVHSGDWAIGGHALTTQDVRTLAAGNGTKADATAGVAVG
jgi:4-oxalocrotonate tautomerase